MFIVTILIGDLNPNLHLQHMCLDPFSNLDNVFRHKNLIWINAKVRLEKYSVFVLVNCCCLFLIIYVQQG